MKSTRSTVIPMKFLVLLVLNILLPSRACLVAGSDEYKFHTDCRGNPWEAQKGCIWPISRNAEVQATHNTNMRIYPYFIIALSGIVLIALVIGTIFYCRNKARTENEAPPMESALEEDGEMMEEEATMDKEVVEISMEE